MNRSISSTKRRNGCATEIEKLEEDLKRMGAMAPFAAINYLCCGMGYRDYIIEYARKRKLREEDLLEILEEIQQSSRPYRTF